MDETNTFEELRHSVLQKNVWDYLFFASLGIVAIWLVLKFAGVI